MNKTCFNCGTPITKEYCEDWPNVCGHWTQKKPQTNADRMIAMIQNGQTRDLLDWWEEIFEDGVPGDDYFEWWLRQPVKDGEGDVD